MDRYKSLYKENIANLIPREHKVSNRAIQNESRTLKRNELFMRGRNISASPTRNMKLSTIDRKLGASYNKENVPDMQQLGRNKIPEKGRTVPSKSMTGSANLSRKDMYMKRFVEWKKKKQNEGKETQPLKPAPFIPSGSSHTSKNIFANGAMTEKHNQLKPPVGLQKSALANEKEMKKLRASIYMPKDTPPKKKKVEAHIKKRFGLAHTATVNSLQPNPIRLTGKVGTKAVAKNKENSKITTTASVQNAGFKPNKQGRSNASRNTKGKTQNKIDLKTSKQQPIPKSSSSTDRPMSTVLQKTGKKLHPVQIGKSGGAIGKIKQMQQKRIAIVAAKQSSQKSSTSIRIIAPKQHISNLKLNNSKLEKIPKTCAMVETPAYVTTDAFTNFVTSTQVKAPNSSNVTQEFAEISPVEMMQGTEVPCKRSLSLSSSAKRALLQKDNNLGLQEENTNKKTANRAVSIKARPKAGDNVVVDKENDPLPLQQTPPKRKDDAPPLLSPSPFGSVRRGKVNRKVEETKRESLYLPSHEVARKNTTVDIEKLAQSKLSNSPEVRRTLEAVRYFRKQLDSEIIRLNALIDEWDAYKSNNIVETNAIDMINVTIGQTKLLVSKKFAQFRGLIKRCEAGAYTPNIAISDCSDDSKPIRAIDLEGFWSMMWLQVENVEKRFKNLELWKANNWEDPDEVKVPIKKNLNKIKKAKKPTKANICAKPSSALRDMLRGLIEERRKAKATISAASGTPKKTSTNAIDVDAETVPSSPMCRSSRRISVIVKDRKFHSLAPTILSIQTPPSLNRNKHKSPLKSGLTVRGRRRSLKKCNASLHKDLINSMISKTEEECGATEYITPQKKRPMSAVLKSALKTPGSAKSPNKSVAFNETLSIRKFTLDEDGHYDDEVRIGIGANSEVERAYCLRNRKVLLRPSTDILIP